MIQKISPLRLPEESFVPMNPTTYSNYAPKLSACNMGIWKIRINIQFNIIKL